MKRKNILALLLILVMMSAVLTGCGASTKSEAYANGAMEAPAAMDMAMQEEAMESEVLYSSSAAGSAAPENAVDQKLITTVNINAETEDLDPFMEQIGSKITALGGYIEYQDVYNGSAYASYRYRSASMTIRIPAENLDGFVEQVKDFSNVVSYNESQENVTLTYVATESRVKALETQEKRLLELLEKAENMTELLEIEARLSEVRYELESVASRLRVLSNQVDYATVHLDIDQVKVYTEVEEQTVWQRIGSGFSKNLKNLGDELVNLFVWIVTYSPQLLIFAAIVVLVILLIKRSSRKRRVKKAPMPPFDTSFETPAPEKEEK